MLQLFFLLTLKCFNPHYKNIRTEIHQNGFILLQTHLPKWVLLFGKKLKVLVRKLQRWKRVESQVCPRAKERGQVDKRVKTQSIIPVVGQVGHEYAYLEWKGDKTEQGIKMRIDITTTERNLFPKKVKFSLQKLSSLLTWLHWKARLCVSVNSGYQYLPSATFVKENCVFTFIPRRFQAQKGKQIN